MGALIQIHICIYELQHWNKRTHAHIKYIKILYVHMCVVTETIKCFDIMTTDSPRKKINVILGFVRTYKRGINRNWTLFDPRHFKVGSRFNTVKI